MRIYFNIICFSLLSFSFLKAQTPNSGPGTGVDSLNATFVPVNMLLKQDLVIMNGIEYIDILNVSILTELFIFDINGREVYQTKIDQRTRIDKQQFEKGFYIIRTRSAERETIKKLYL